MDSIMIYSPGPNSTQSQRPPTGEPENWLVRVSMYTGSLDHAPAVELNLLGVRLVLQEGSCAFLGARARVGIQRKSMELER